VLGPVTEAHHQKKHPKMKEFLELPQLIDINHTLIIKKLLKTWKIFPWWEQRLYSGAELQVPSRP